MAYLFLVVDSAEREAAQSARQIQAAQRGAEVIVATTGEEALALLVRRKVVPSLIFLNFNLPDMNGIEFLGRVRQARWLARAPVAMLTEPVSDRGVIACHRLGVCAFLTKPVQTFDLRESLRDYAREARALGGDDVPEEPGGPHPRGLIAEQRMQRRPHLRRAFDHLVR